MNPSIVIPSGAGLGTIRLQADTDGTAFIWDNIIVRDNDAREFVVADRPVRVQRLGNLLATKEDTWGKRGDSWETVPHELQQLDSGLWRYDTQQSLAGLSVWYEEYLETAAMTADSDTTTINKRELAAIAAERLLRPLRATKKWARWYEDAALGASRVRQAFASRATILDNRTRSYYRAPV